jgi:hypothetical protein
MNGREQAIDKRHVTALRKAAEELPPPDYDASWMGEEANCAMLISLGAGPWKVKRRFDVQRAAVEWFLKQHVSDLSQLQPDAASAVYPLLWQNNHLQWLIASLRANKRSFDTWCSTAIFEGLDYEHRPGVWETYLDELFEMCGVKEQGTKVLWMFARDFLGYPAFPIDRHVRRHLQARGLPTDPWYISRACLAGGVPAGELNRAMFSGVNPDWSKKGNDNG